MLYVSFTSFWIKELEPGEFSLIHILSVVTIVTVSLGIWAAWRGNIQSHRGNMIGSWMGLIDVACLSTFSRVNFDAGVSFMFSHV